MIKGVNKRIIEINEFDSQIFDKAILFIKPTAKFYNEFSLNNEAKKYLKGLEENKSNNHNLRARRKRLLVKNRIVFCFVGILLSAIFFTILNIII